METTPLTNNQIDQLVDVLSDPNLKVDIMVGSPADQLGSPEYTNIPADSPLWTAPQPFPWKSLGAGLGIGLLVSAAAYGGYYLLDRRSRRKAEATVNAAPQPTTAPPQAAEAA